ncbi:MAG: Uma2 family endonuclease [Lachnospiraceae bacterium]|nr:Uma2 family endonuclease [Lachnospiraceae bacterium]
MEAGFFIENTVADIEAMPEDVRAQLIDGQIYYMAPPSTVHQRIISKLVFEIRGRLEEMGRDCEVLPAPFGVYIADDDRNLVEPDISVICDRDKIDDKGCHGAPEWVIEIVSPSSKKLDYSIKLFKYRTAGVKEYWIIDPEIRQVQIRDFENEDYACTSFDEPAACMHMPEIKIDLSGF